MCILGAQCILTATVSRFIVSLNVQRMQTLFITTIIYDIFEWVLFLFSTQLLGPMAAAIGLLTNRVT